MTFKEQQKQVLFIDLRAQERINILNAEIRTIQNEISAYFKEFELLYTHDEKQTITNQFKDKFLKHYKNEFPNIVTDQKRFELANVNFNKLFTLESKLHNVLSELDSTEANIYANNDEELKRYKSIDKWLKDTSNFLKQMEATESEQTIFFYSLVRFKYFDRQYGKIIPNMRFVKNQRT